MCSPAIAAGAGGVLGAVNIYQQQQNAEAMYEAEEQRYRTEVQRAQRDAETQRNLLEQQALSDSMEINRDRQSLALESLRQAASQRAASAESGLGGVSTLRQLVATDIQEGQQASIINTNEQMANTKYYQESLGIDTNYKDRLENSRARLKSTANQASFGWQDYALGSAQGALSGFSQAGGFSSTPSGTTSYTSSAPTYLSRNTPSYTPSTFSYKPKYFGS